MVGEIMRKLLLTGVGAALLTKEKIEEVVGDMVNQGKISKEEGAGLVNDLVNRANLERERMNLKVKEEVQRNLRRSGMVTEADLRELKQELYTLRDRVVQLENQQQMHGE